MLNNIIISLAVLSYTTVKNVLRWVSQAKYLGHFILTENLFILSFEVYIVQVNYKQKIDTKKLPHLAVQQKIY